ncbi:MAG: ferritin [Terrisporobacter othiniensis]|uniref:Ferritin n=1 Tax=Terrisporobacter hibernicus TaxID=2813371 RepID=A0AAX2ZE70_9FIRM|nr:MULTISPECIES: ferritin [Terrisporobacter]MBN9646684.1 ferritin [Terrisporobacter glycolicus]MDU4859378.1 ferritin [Terrisporobacter othiniensis]MDU6993765.1 ferritin [Terrisporobacter othiniensis]UEL46670.1 ferritin [Terrisporobacter hibernicus]UPA29699.1 ferritin [Terrisporobacter glycolicus]
MLSEKLEKSLNDQITFEFYSSYTYLAMSAFCESSDLSGFANFFRVQAKEELDHAMKLYDYVFQKGGKVILGEVEQPKKEYDNMVDVFETGLEHERMVTSRIYAITDIATEEREHATMSFLKWFIDEQVEEENNFNSLLKKVKRCENNPAALYMLDDELANRTYVAPVTN